jgi:F-type H+-transporting ATPase subunit gamma
MPSLQSLRRKIGAVKNTQKITKAMKMVAAAKLKRAQDRILSARPYAHKLREVMGNLSSRVNRSAHPLLQKRPGRTIEVLIVSSDRGLCGAFNANIIRKAMEFIRQAESQRGAKIALSLVGRKGRDFFRRRSWPIRQQWMGVFDRLTYEHGIDIGHDLAEQFTAGAFDELYVIYNEFKSAIQQRVIVEKLFPIDTLDNMTSPKDAALGGSYLYEPQEDELLAALLPKHFEIQTFRILLESSAAEQGARMAAMDGATRNAGELIKRVTLYYNKTRQAAITKELMDIVGGAEALKG